MNSKIILGVDPGLRKTGFGLIEFKKKVNYIDSGVIVTAQGALPTKIKTLFINMLEIIKEYKPHFVSFEKVFININPNSSLLLGQARGALIASAVSKNLNIFEYTALQVKKSVVGKGHANKQIVFTCKRTKKTTNRTKHNTIQTRRRARWPLHRT